MKNVLQKSAIENTLQIKKVLATLLQSLKDFLSEIDYHGNINPQSIIAIPEIPKSEQKINIKNKKVIKKKFI